MFCENCGDKISNAAKFCEGCGKATEASQTATAPMQPQQSPPIMYQAHPQNAVTPKKKTPVGKIIGFSVAGLILIAAAVIIIFKPGNLQYIYHSKPSTTIAKVIQTNKMPEYIGDVDFTGRWYMLVSYYKEPPESDPPYLFYKLQLDVKRTWLGIYQHDGTVTMLEARYNKEHKDYPGDDSTPPDVSGEVGLSGYGNTVCVTLRSNNPYYKTLKFEEWEVKDGNCIQFSMRQDYYGNEEGELYPTGYLSSEDFH